MPVKRDTDSGRVGRASSGAVGAAQEVAASARCTNFGFTFDSRGYSVLHFL